MSMYIIGSYYSMKYYGKKLELKDSRDFNPKHMFTKKLLEMLENENKITIERLKITQMVKQIMNYDSQLYIELCIEDYSRFKIHHHNVSIIEAYLVISYIIDYCGVEIENDFIVVEKEITYICLFNRLMSIVKKSVYLSQQKRVAIPIVDNQIFILSQDSTAKLFHEFIGHFFEEDIFPFNNAALIDKCTFFNSSFNWQENYSLHSGFIDDNGNKPVPVHLISDGKWQCNTLNENTGNIYSDKKLIHKCVRSKSAHLSTKCVHDELHHANSYIYIDAINSGGYLANSNISYIEIKSAWLVKNKSRTRIYLNKGIISFEDINIFNSVALELGKRMKISTLCMKNNLIHKIDVHCKLMHFSPIHYFVYDDLFHYQKEIKRKYGDDKDDTT